MRTLASSSPGETFLFACTGPSLERMVEVRSAGDWRNAAASCNLRMSLKFPVLPTIPQAEVGLVVLERCGVDAGTKSLGSGLRIFVLSLGKA